MENIEISNFKRIQNLKIDGFKRINLISGTNNCGKSSLLEAIFLLKNITSLNIAPILINSGISRTFDGTSNILKMNGYFRGYDFNHKVIIKNNDSNSIQMSASDWELINLATSKNSTSQKSYTSQTDMQSSKLSEVSRKIIVDITFNEKKKFSLEVVENNVQVVGGIFNHLFLNDVIRPVCSFIDDNNSIKVEHNNYSIFNEITKIVTNNLESELVVNALQIFDPKIIGIALVPTNFSQGNILLAHSDYSHKLSLQTYGMGIKKVLNIVMTIINNKDGIVLVDEIENGIHYSIMPKLWKAIAQLTKKYNCQLFATTHSREFAKSILSDHNTWDLCRNNFTFLTLNFYENEKIVPSLYYGEDFKISLLEDNSELRG